MISIAWPYFFRVLLPAIITLIAAIIVERIFTLKISNYAEKKNLPPTQTHTIKLITRWIIVISTILIEVTIFGIGIGRLWIVISSIAAMIIVGFIAIWSLLGNILAAIILMIWKPFQIGDKITLYPENITGKVKEINLFFTRIENEEGDIINTTNTTVMSKFIQVHSKNQKDYSN